MNAAITNIAYCLPEGKLTSDDLSARFGADVVGKIERITGIRQRRISAPGECASDMAFRAAEALFESGVDKAKIDMLIFATQTPDYLIPSTSCILQDRLGLSKSTAAFDINLGCSQFPYALATAKAWVECGLCKNALVLTGDTPSKLLHPMDRSSVSVFSDAASACLVEASSEPSILAFDFGTDGSGAEDLIWPTSGLRHPLGCKDFEEFKDPDNNVRTNANMKVDGFKIFTFAQRCVQSCIRSLLKKAGTDASEIDLFLFHQAGEITVRSAANKLGIAPDKIHFRLADIGNCGGTSLVVALADAVISGKLKPGMNVVLCAFGAGLSWGSALLKWPKAFKRAIEVG